MSQDHKQQILSRLKSIEGHVRGVHRMVEEDKYCIDVIKQTLAIQRALDMVNTLMLGNHLNTCVTTAIRSQDAAERERVISELLDIFDTAGKL
jgi:DNA-binding FrmR family transcriptional regulator